MRDPRGYNREALLTLDPAQSPSRGGGSFSRIAVPSLARGTYTIKVREYGNNGKIPAYTLRAAWTSR